MKMTFSPNGSTAGSHCKARSELSWAPGSKARQLTKDGHRGDHSGCPGTRDQKRREQDRARAGRRPQRESKQCEKHRGRDAGGKRVRMENGR